MDKGKMKCLLTAMAIKGLPSAIKTLSFTKVVKVLFYYGPCR